MDQSWHNRRSKWRRKFLFRSLGPLGGAAAFLANAVLIAALSVWMARLGRGLPTIPTMYWEILAGGLLMALLLLVVACCFIRAFVRLHRVRRAVLASDGRVCPWCRLAMPEAGDDGVCRCDRCASAHPVGVVRQYWANFALNAYEANHWFEEHHPKRDRLWRRLMRSAKPPSQAERIRWPWVAVSMLPVIIVAGMIWRSTRNPIVAMLAGMLVLAASIGWMFIARRLQPKREQSRHCASCDYQLAPGENAGERCPECAAVWTAPGAVYSGRRPEQNKLVLANLVIAAVVWFAIFGSGPWLGTARLTSDGALMNKVVSGRGFLFDEWAELNRRELTVEQQAELAQGLLDRRERRHTLEREAYAWVIGRIADESLPPPFAEEFHAGTIRTRLLAPDRAKVGEEITIGIENINRYQDPMVNQPQPMVIFGGYLLDDDPAPHQRATQARSIIGFGTRVFSYGQMQMGYDGEGPALKIVPRQPGTLRIRARYWIIGSTALAGPQPQPLEWREDGTPTMPAGTAWAYERVLEHEVRVE